MANHYVSAGKKQCTWGHSDFGRTWDRNLTDRNCLCIELMMGLHTNNQPSINWLTSYEKKLFTQ
jgi:hypothetical protein